MIENKIHLSNSTLDDRFDNKMVPKSQKKWKFEKIERVIHRFFSFFKEKQIKLIRVIFFTFLDQKLTLITKKNF
jgi:hypothetical protein